tara:strand:+ start:80 stop:628 length:549 start_codon:yes stop_codon:yes gene_type:complete
MGVPNTTTFSLQDVIDIVSPTTNDLVDSFADAVANKFDPSYSGSKNQLLNFRNYDGSCPVGTICIKPRSLTPPIFNPTTFALLENETTTSQVVSYKWQYVSQTGTRTVMYDGVARSPGYTTPTLTQNFGTGVNAGVVGLTGWSFPAATGSTVMTFKFTLLGATVDSVPTSPFASFTIYPSLS